MKPPQPDMRRGEVRALYPETKCPGLIASLKRLAVIPIRTGRFPIERERAKEALQRVCLRDP